MFGFENLNKIERGENFKFNKNFLRTVIFQVGFPETKECINNKKDIISLFEPHFPRVNDIKPKNISISFKKDQTPILQTSDNPNEGFEMRSNDGQKIIFVDTRSFTYTINGKSYTNFDSLLADVKLINHFFDICKIKTTNRIAIRKINIIDFNIKTEDDPTESLKYLLNPDLINDLNYLPNTKYIKQKFHSINYQNQDNRLNINYGLSIIPPNFNLGQVIIDIDLFNLSILPIEQIFDKFIEINKEIFNIFTWSLNDNALKILNE